MTRRCSAKALAERTFAIVLLCLVGQPAFAQSKPAAPPRPVHEEPPLALRPFVLLTDQAFAAKQTVEAGFGKAVQPFYGGGLEFVEKSYYIDLTASRFKKTGERAFVANGQTFHLGLPLEVTITPFEFTFGYRFTRSRTVVPFGGAGIGSYRYQETSKFNDPAENVDARKTGYLAAGGVEFRAANWLRISVDAQYTHVTGILGVGGVSKAVGEDDLGGVAARLKVVLGK